MYKLPTKYIVIAIVAVLAFVGIAMFGMPIYRVWSQEMRGKAQLAEAEQNRRIKVEEARANPETLKYYASADETEGSAESEEQNNPFAALKDMFK